MMLALKGPIIFLPEPEVFAVEVSTDRLRILTTTLSTEFQPRDWTRAGRF